MECYKYSYPSYCNSSSLVINNTMIEDIAQIMINSKFELYEQKIEADFSSVNDSISNVQANLDDYKIEVKPASNISTSNYSGVTRTQAEKNTDVISVKDFGAIGDGITDDTLALQKAFNSGKVVNLTGGDYLYTQITVNNPLRLVGKGTLKYSGLAGTGVDATLIFNASVTMEHFNVVTDGATDAIYDIAVFLADDIHIGAINIKSRVQRLQTGGCVFAGSDITIGDTNTVNIGRPLAFTNELGIGADLSKWRSNIHIGDVYVNTYMRGVKFRFVENFSMGDCFIHGLWAGRTTAPGFNGVLIETFKNFKAGSLYIADSLEHGFRFGGDIDSAVFSITSVYTMNTLGCGFKNAPTPPFKTRQGRIGSITVYDAGVGTSGGNAEAVRLSSLEDITIGEVSVLKQCTDGIQFADVKGVHIGKFYVEGVSSRAVSFHMGRDMTLGDCENITIGTMVAKCKPIARHAIGAVQVGTRSIKNFRILDSYITGFNYSAVDFENILLVDSDISVTLAKTETLPAFTNMPDGNTVTIKQSGSYYFGAAKRAFIRGVLTVDSPKMNAASNSDLAGVYVSSAGIMPAKEALGGWLGFSRLGSSRRAAGIAVIQTDTADTKNGLAFYTQNNSTTANEGVQMSMQLKHNGTMNLPQLPTSAAGLVAGDLWNDAGVLKIIP